MRPPTRSPPACAAALVRFFFTNDQYRSLPVVAQVKTGNRRGLLDVHRERLDLDIELLAFLLDRLEDERLVRVAIDVGAEVLLDPLTRAAGELAARR